MDQLKLPLFGRLDGPSVVPVQYVKACASYREACRLAWDLRRVPNMTRRTLAAEAGLVAQHVTDYLIECEQPHRRSLPANRVAAFEGIVGNCLVSQWMAAQVNLTVLEEMQATRAAA